MNTCGASNPALLLALLAAANVFGSLDALAVPPSAAAMTPLPAGVPLSPAAKPTASAAITPAAVAPETASYDVGLMLGNQLEHSGAAPTLSVDALIRGLKDGVGGRAITVAERDAAQRYMRAARDALAARNQAAGREFLEHNAKEPGVLTMPSGLQYRVLAKGDPSGKPPAPTDDVTVRYRASLTDGTEFDRSETHDRPATFRVHTVFKGWQEAFLAMKPGAKWQLFVPPELGYGANPPPAVPPGAVLVYEVELLTVQPAPPLASDAAKRIPAAHGTPPAAATPAATDSPH